jgi:hypothetical protein
MGVLVDDEQAIAEAMLGGDIRQTPQVKRHVEKGTGEFRESGSGAWCNSGLVEQA